MRVSLAGLAVHYGHGRSTSMDIRYLLGRISPNLAWLTRLSHYASLGEFVGCNRCPGFPDRVALYRWLSGTYVGNAPMCLIELGVWKGETIAHWARVNANPASRFIGLDTFEGLPEDWHHLFGKSPKGTFTANGELPSNADPRVGFRKGLIQNTLKSLLTELQLGDSRLVVHFDADLYSTTLYGLATVDSVLLAGIGSYVAVFDEFSSAADEYRAFRDYVAAFRRSYRVLGHVGRSFNQAAISIFTA